ncbi:hypothetical protein B296_00055374 [Ensete ventricosum]|uniref:Uncharacterized protein n=1 Tax=Ensete ventricosum TaxID=4639 RepID=A0A426XZY9_ENSVE|nr:hypothetical protein B296_00055374 [Ensete ventricosum]
MEISLVILQDVVLQLVLHLVFVIRPDDDDDDDDISIRQWLLPRSLRYLGSRKQRLSHGLNPYLAGPDCMDSLRFELDYACLVLPAPNGSGMDGDTRKNKASATEVILWDGVSRHETSCVLGWLPLACSGDCGLLLVSSHALDSCGWPWPPCPHVTTLAEVDGPKRKRQLLWTIFFLLPHTQYKTDCFMFQPQIMHTCYCLKSLLKQHSSVHRQ